MNDKIKLWVEALESDEYTQTQSALHQVKPDTEKGIPAGYCCLGVLCEVAAKSGLDLPRVVYDDLNLEAFGGETAFLPGAVAEWLGVELDTERYMTMNDERGMSFAEIAAEIRSDFA